MCHPGMERDKRAVRLQEEGQGRGGGLHEWEGLHVPTAAWAETDIILPVGS